MSATWPSARPRPRGGARRRAGLLALVAAVSVVIAGCGSSPVRARRQSGPPTTSTSSPATTPAHHGGRAAGPAATAPQLIISGSAVATLQASAGAAFVRRYLDSPRTILLVGKHIPAELAPWSAHFDYYVRSVAQLQAALAQGLPSQVSDLLYDPEHWAFTPLSEQLDVAAAAARAATLARGAGLGLVVAPATDLAEVTAPGRPVAAAFLASGILAGVSTSAAAVEIQAQGLESDPSRYAAFVREAVLQIREANPRAEVFAGLSTNPSGKLVTAGELLESVALTRHLVSGYWLNIPSQGVACPRCGSPQPQIAVSLLQELDQSAD